MPPDKPAEAETYVAAERLYYYTPGVGVMPDLAYRPGESITAAELARHPEWRDKVRDRAAARRAERRSGSSESDNPSPGRGRGNRTPPTGE